jgi:cold shock CspA family protein
VVRVPYDAHLEEGAEVEFEVKTGPKGLQAENVNRP